MKTIFPVLLAATALFVAPAAHAAASFGTVGEPAVAFEAVGDTGTAGSNSASSPDFGISGAGASIRPEVAEGWSQAAQQAKPADQANLSGWGINVMAIPEPGTWAMMMFGLTVIGYAMRRRDHAVAFA